METALGELAGRIATLREDIARARADLAELNAQRDSLRQAATRQQAAVAREFRQAWRGSDAQLRLLLSQDDPQVVARLLAYYRHIVRARTELLADYEQTLKSIDEIDERLMQRAAALQTQLVDQAERRRELELRQSEREGLLAELDAQSQDAEAQLEQRKQDRQQLEQLLEEIEAALAAAAIGAIGEQPFSTAQGQMPWPVEGRISNRFGRSRGPGARRWQGIRLSAAAGEPVNAIHHGRVVYADWLRGSGLLLVLDHGEGFLSLYAHNASLLRAVGDSVRSGAPIATVGNSGGQSESALYFEIRKDGRPVDPAPWMVDRER